jgi:predicted transcriptional regulator
MYGAKLGEMDVPLLRAISNSDGMYFKDILHSTNSPLTKTLNLLYMEEIGFVKREMETGKSKYTITQAGWNFVTDEA